MNILVVKAAIRLNIVGPIDMGITAERLAILIPAINIQYLYIAYIKVGFCQSPFINHRVCM